MLQCYISIVFLVALWFVFRAAGVHNRIQSSRHETSMIYTFFYRTLSVPFQPAARKSSPTGKV